MPLIVWTDSSVNGSDKPRSLLPGGCGATSTIPIVGAIVANPVGTGLVSSLVRPTGNLTALTVSTPGLRVKYIELLRDVLLGLARVAGPGAAQQRRWLVGVGRVLARR
jgi:hypothetical protein